jgi:hypothetical protein
MGRRLLRQTDAFRYISVSRALAKAAVAQVAVSPRARRSRKMGNRPYVFFDARHAAERLANRMSQKPPVVSRSPLSPLQVVERP